LTHDRRYDFFNDKEKTPQLQCCITNSPVSTINYPRELRHYHEGKDLGAWGASFRKRLGSDSAAERPPPLEPSQVHLLDRVAVLASVCIFPPHHRRHHRSSCSLNEGHLRQEEKRLDSHTHFGAEKRIKETRDKAK
jgi:hypothetical protein